jgi:hypothetical protein
MIIICLGHMMVNNKLFPFMSFFFHDFNFFFICIKSEFYVCQNKEQQIISSQDYTIFPYFLGHLDFEQPFGSKSTRQEIRIFDTASFCCRLTGSRPLVHQ